MMLTLLVSLLLSDHQADVAVYEKLDSDAQKLLSAAGYRSRFVPVSRGVFESPLGTSVVYVKAAGDRTASRRTVGGFSLIHRWLIDRYVRPTTLDKWASRQAGVQPDYRSNLDHIVTVRQEVWLEQDGRTPKQLKKTLDGFVAANLAFRDEFAQYMKPRSLKPDGRVTPPPVGDDLLVESVDEYDLMYLTNQWGWRYPKGWVSTGVGWKFPIEVDGRKFWLAGHHARYDSGLLIFSTVPMSQDTDIAATIDEFNKTTAWGKLRDIRREREVQVRSEFVYEPPFAVGSIKAFIGTFARNTEQLADRFQREPPALRTSPEPSPRPFPSG